MERTQTRRRIPAVLVAGTLSLMLVVTMVQRASEAAFTAQTQNANNTFGAAELSLSNDRATMQFSEMFAEPKLIPGQTVSNCIVITYSGDVGTNSPKAVKLYGNGADNGLGTSLDMVVSLYGATQTCATGTPQSNVFTGTLDAFRVNRTSYVNGAPGWTPTENDRTRAFHFSVTLRGGVGNQQQGKGATQTFTWEIQS